MSCGYGTVWHVIWNVLGVELKWKVKSHLDFTGSFYLQFNGSWVIRVIEGNCEVTPSFNSLRLRKNGRHFLNDIFKCICVYQNIWISIKISLKFVSKGQIHNNPSLVQIMAWHRPGDKPLSEPMMAQFTDPCMPHSDSMYQWLGKSWNQWLGTC